MLIRCSNLINANYFTSLCDQLVFSVSKFNIKFATSK